MKRFLLLAGTITLAISVSGQTKPVRHPVKASAPVPQSAQIAELNRQSLAKISSRTVQKPAADSAKK